MKPLQQSAMNEEEIKVQDVKFIGKDGAALSRYQAHPATDAKGCVIVLQAIFGVNQHVKAITREFARNGYFSIAPRLFARLDPDIQLGYSNEDIERGVELRSRTKLQDVLDDVHLCALSVDSRYRIGIIGYCWGGTLSYISACRIAELSAAVCYYGYGIADRLDEDTPKIDTMMHFGEQDHLVPLSDVSRIRRRLAHLPIYTYNAGHGFACDERDSYDPTSARLAGERTLDFFEERLRIRQKV